MGVCRKLETTDITKRSVMNLGEKFGHRPRDHSCLRSKFHGQIQIKVFCIAFGCFLL